MNTTAKRNIGTNRGKARIWLEGKILEAAGWAKGTKFKATFGKDCIEYTKDDNGDRKVAGTETRPIIDTNTDKIKSSLGEKASKASIEIVGKTIRITAAALALAGITFGFFPQHAKAVLVACEYSGTVRDAFAAQGHDAVSCDLLPSDSPIGTHFQGDVTPLLEREWEILLGFPPCTFLTGAAAWALKDPDYERYPEVGYHQKVAEGTLTGAARRQARLEAGAFARLLWDSCDKVCIENPRGGLTKFIPDAHIQEIQPYDFGEDASKATCLRLKNLPDLVPTQYVEPRWVGGKPRWANQTDSGQNRLGPSKDRWKIRSKTFHGIAQAFATQWGSVI